MYIFDYIDIFYTTSFVRYDFDCQDSDYIQILKMIL